MTPIELKEYIFEHNKHAKILEKLECRAIKEHKKYFTCGRPSGRNLTGIQLYKQSLKVVIYTPDLQQSKHYKAENADIFTLVMIIKDCSFSQASRWLHEQLGLKYTSYNIHKEKPKKACPLNIFTKHKKRRYNDVRELELINNEILNDFIPFPHINWIREGVLPSVAEEFGIGYSERRKRIIIPHRYWCGDKDDYVGIIGRTTVSDDLIELLDIPKYFPIVSYPKNLNLYGLNENYQGIQSKNYAVVYEAEKSVLKRASRLDRTDMAVCCHTISEAQAKILIGLDVEIIIAYDSDIPEEILWGECAKFYGIRQVSYMYDTQKILLKDKQSPADAREMIYQYLFKHRIKYDEQMHKRYLKWMKNKNN